MPDIVRHVIDMRVVKRSLLSRMPSYDMLSKSNTITSS
jgi:hypothetical protein